MTDASRILLIMKNTMLAHNLERELKRRGCEVSVFSEPVSQVLSQTARNRNVIAIGIYGNLEEVVLFIRDFKNESRETPVIGIMDTTSEGDRIEILRAGADAVFSLSDDIGVIVEGITFHASFRKELGKESSKNEGS